MTFAYGAGSHRISDHPDRGRRIALAYYNAHRQDGWAAAVAVVTDALADLGEAEQRSQRRDRLISRGYVRGRTSTGL